MLRGGIISGSPLQARLGCRQFYALRFQRCLLLDDPSPRRLQVCPGVELPGCRCHRWCARLALGGPRFGPWTTHNGNKVMTWTGFGATTNTATHLNRVENRLGLMVLCDLSEREGGRHAPALL